MRTDLFRQKYRACNYLHALQLALLVAKNMGISIAKTGIVKPGFLENSFKKLWPFRNRKS